MKHPEVHTADADFASDDPEFSIGDLVRIVWSIRGWLVGGIVIAVLAMVALILLFRVASYEKITEYVIEFRFEGRNNNQYPNGTPFSLSDIVAPAVLSQIYEDDQISRYGMTFRDFQSAVTVAPFSLERQKIIDQFSTIDAKRATVAEFSEAQQKLERDLDAAMKRYAVLRLTAGGFSIPSNEAAKILVDVAKAWERNAIDTRGVVKVDLPAVSPALFEEVNFQGLEKLNKLKFLHDNVAQLRRFVVQISNLPSGELVTDKSTGYTTAVLLNAIDRATLQLTEVAAGWSGTRATDRSETLGVPVNLNSDRLFDPSQLENLDYPIAIDLIRERINLIRANVTRINDIDFGAETTDPTSGFTTNDISKLLDDLDDYTIKRLVAPVVSFGIAKDANLVSIYYNSRLRDLQRQKDTLVNKSRVLDQASQTYQGWVAGASASGQATPGFPPNTSTVIPQLSDNFLDRIIGLSQKGDDTAFRQKLLGESVDLQQQVADIDSEISRITEYTKMVANSDSFKGENATNAENYAYFSKMLDAELPATFAKLKSYAQITERIAYRLRYAQDIYSISMADGEKLPADGSNALKTDFFLRDVPASTDNQTKAVAAELKGYAQIAGNLYDQISKVALGNYQTLFKSANDPGPARAPLLDRFQLLLLAFAAVGGGIIGLVAALLWRLLRRPASAHA